MAEQQKYDRRKISDELKKEILYVIRRPLPTEWEEQDIYFWLSRLAEAKRYVLLKLRVLDDKAYQIKEDITIFENNTYKAVQDEGIGSVSERRKISEARYKTDKNYNDLLHELRKVEAATADVNSDLENVAVFPSLSTHALLGSILTVRVRGKCVSTYPTSP